MPPEPELQRIETLESLPIGARLQARVIGHCMAPLIQSGDIVAVRRCGPDSVAEGDVAIVRTADRRFLAHLVVQAQPLRTATLRGSLDPERLELLGQVTEIRKKAVTIPLSRWTRHALRLFQRSRERASRIKPLTHLAIGAFRGVQLGVLPARIRRGLLRPIRVRRLNLLDAEELRVFAGHYLVDSPDFLKRQLLTRWNRSGAAVAAVDRFGRWCGFAYLGAFREEGFALEGFGIRSLFVAPFARGLGLERRMTMLLCQEAQRQAISPVYVNVVDENPGLLAVLEELGFSPSAHDRAHQVESEWAKRGVIRRWAALERS